MDFFKNSFFGAPLLSSPKDTIVRSVAPGKYFHYGLEKGLIDQLNTTDMSNFKDVRQINVRIDGLPI